MADMMNRAARRAARMHKAAPIIRVSNRIDVVPMEHVESFYQYEIAREGKWRSDVPLIIIRPDHEKGEADDAWFPRTLARMREARQRKGSQTLSLSGTEVDVGLVDIAVFFQLMPGNGFVRPRTREESDKLLRENLVHVDKICGDAIHDQMIIAIAPHIYHSNGTLLYHYHNLIFGLRQEVRGEMDLLAPLDMDPLLKTLSKSGPLSVIGGTRQ
jgi:hypothetical protein